MLSLTIHYPFLLDDACALLFHQFVGSMGAECDICEFRLEMPHKSSAQKKKKTTEAQIPFQIVNLIKLTYDLRQRYEYVAHAFKYNSILTIVDIFWTHLVDL